VTVHGLALVLKLKLSDTRVVLEAAVGDIFERHEMTSPDEPLCRVEIVLVQNADDGVDYRNEFVAGSGARL
jgi:hypothetical protein